MAQLNGIRRGVATALGRLTRTAMRLRGGGSAVPGRVALMIAPDFLRTAVSGLRLGVVFVSGSNGKSTTTHFLTTMLRAHGLKVFTNSSGGNLPQGIASSMLPDVGRDGRLHADIAVLEVDEAFGPQLLEHLNPRGVLLLNVQVDQLNRFHDPARVAGFLETIANHCRDFAILNADDDSLRALGTRLSQPIRWFGVSEDVARTAPNGLSNFEQVSGAADPVPDAARDVQVVGLGDRRAQMRIDGAVDEVALPARGLHYAVDAAGAIATARQVLGAEFRAATVREALATTKTVYGRGEILTYRGEEIEIIMMKNPPSLQMNMDALAATPEQVLFAVDEGTPDPSWIYGSDLSRLAHVDIVAGTKAWQIASRLEYGGIDVHDVEPNTSAAVDAFLRLPRPSQGRKLMIVNYEEMMAIRRKLGASGLEGKVNS